MKKYNFYLWLTVLVGLFASCSQDEAAGPQTNTESNRVTFTASLPADFAQPGTRALPAAPNGHKLRCILEVWDETYANLKVRQEVCPDHTDQFINFTFELQQIGNYNAVLWADYIDATATSSSATIAGLSDVAHFPDKYYTTDAVDNGLRAVSLKGDYPYTDERDAFCVSIDFEKRATALDNLSASLLRPLTLLTIAENSENFGYCQTVKATYTIPTTINVCTGELSGEKEVSYNDHPVGKTITIKSVECKTLFSDYIFAPDGGGTMGDIVLEFIPKQGSNKELSTPVTIPAGVPVQANRKINAGGNLIIAQDAPSNSVRMTVDMASWEGSQDKEILPPHIWDGKYPSSEAEAKEWMGEPTSAPGQTPATYTISTAKQLAGMAYYYSAGMIEKETFELAADIDLAEHPWIPLGLFESKNTTYSFKGTFNGHGHTIKGMNVTGNYNHSGFMDICAGTVKNLIVEGKVNSSFSNANLNLECGGIAGELSSAFTGHGDIIACGFRGTIVGSATSAKNAFFGGIVGRNEAGNITGCISWATSVTATGGSTNNRVGGIVGFFDKYTHSEITTQPTAKGNRWYYNGTGPEGVQGLSGGTGTDAVPVTEGSTAFANSSEIDDTALNTINSYLTDNDYIWQKAADGNLKLVKNQQP